MPKSPLFAGFSVIPSDRLPNAALPGWGGRYRTGKLPITGRQFCSPGVFGWRERSKRASPIGTWSHGKSRTTPIRAVLRFGEKSILGRIERLVRSAMGIHWRGNMQEYGRISDLSSSPAGPLKGPVGPRPWCRLWLQPMPRYPQRYLWPQKVG